MWHDVPNVAKPRKVLTPRGFKHYTANDLAGDLEFLEAATGFEPVITVLQTVALATWLRRPL